MNLEQIRENTELAGLAEYLQNREISSQLLDGNNNFPISSLLVAFEMEDGYMQNLTLSYVPQAADDFDEIKLLQIYTQLPFEFQEEKRSQLLELLAGYNNRTMVGHFSLVADQPLISFRHTFVQPLAAALPHAMVTELMLLTLFTLDQFSPSIKKITCG